MRHKSGLTRYLELAASRLEQNAAEMDPATEREYRQRLKALAREADRYRDPAEYVSHLSSQLAAAKAIRDEQAAPTGDVTDVTDWEDIENVRSVNWTQTPLCGCDSPTCPVTRGDIPTACRDRSGGLLDDRTPPARVRQFLGRHGQAHALRIAHRSWVEGYGSVQVRALELVKELNRIQDRRAGRRVDA